MPKNEIRRHEYGLETTSNSKTGFAFSLPRAKTCINKTSICASVCYGKGIRYQSEGQRSKRERNYRTVEFLLEKGGPELLAQNLAILIDQARPIDWIAATVSNRPTNVPWTFRIHDVGDFYSVAYIQAWAQAVRQKPDCRFWFYTRSFVEDKTFDELTVLAAEPNCKGWLSLDRENYDLGIRRFCQTEKNVWQFSLLQEDPVHQSCQWIDDVLGRTNATTISFPKHHGGRHVQPVVKHGLQVCPQILGNFELENRSNFAKPCQLCNFCLP